MCDQMRVFMKKIFIFVLANSLNLKPINLKT